MKQTARYSLSREYSDQHGLMLSTSGLGGVIGFATAFSTLVVPDRAMSFSWTLVGAVAICSVLGLALGAAAGLSMSAFFTSVTTTRRALRASRLQQASRWREQVIYLPASIDKKKTEFDLLGVAYGT